MLPQEIPNSRIKKGDCSTQPCKAETACKQYTNGTYFCICPHDNSLPTEDLKCSRVIVPATPSPILLPPLGTNNTFINATARPGTGSIQVGNSYIPPALVPVVFGVCGLVILVFSGLVCFCCYRWSRTRPKPHGRKSPLGMPIEGSTGLLADDKYALNPGYHPAPPDLQSPVASHLPQLSRDAIRFENVIGEGCFGKVYKGKLLQDGEEGKTVAIKMLKDTATPEAEDNFMREVEVMASFQHPNILSLLGFVSKDFGRSPYMIFEFMPHGDLTDVLRGNSKTLWKSDPGFPRLNQNSLFSIASQIAHGMQYLAEQHFIHRDLACRNCLVGENITVKIADFGMSRDVYTCDYYRIGGSRLMPVRWMSPESISYGRFTLESDVWSFGVVLWEIYSLGKQPYFGRSNEEVIKLILRGALLSPPEDCPEPIQEIMGLCWKTEPKERTKFSEIIEKLSRMNRQGTTTCLPRPPPFMVTAPIPEAPELEVEYYLKPEPASPPHEYIQPLPD